MKIDIHFHPGCSKQIDHLFKGLERHVGIGKPGEKACAVMMLDKYRDGYSKYIGQRRQNLVKCSKRGYVFDQFNYYNHVPDIVDINRSKPVRAGGPMKAHYLEGVEQKGGYPKAYRHIDPVACQYHHLGLNFGVFIPAPYYQQGNVITNRRLIAYSALHVCGELAVYSMVIGHGDYLKDGIMTMLTAGVVDYLHTLPHVRYFMYSAWSDGGAGLQLWKIMHLFEPLNLQR
jgi:hypothetical protein